MHRFRGIKTGDLKVFDFSTLFGPTITRRTGPDGAVMCSSINTLHKHTHTHTHSIDPLWEDQCEWYRMTRMIGPDYAVMCNLIHTHSHTLKYH